MFFLYCLNLYLISLSKPALEICVHTFKLFVRTHLLYIWPHVSHVAVLVGLSVSELQVLGGEEG